MVGFKDVGCKLVGNGVGLALGGSDVGGLEVGL